MKRLPRVRAPRPTLPKAADLRRCRDGVLRAVSLVVTDRRWAAPLSAMALGFGLFLGVAIGPGVQGTMATGGAPLLALLESGEEEAAPPAATGAGAPAAEAGEEAWGDGAGFEAETEAEAAAYVPAPEGAEPGPSAAPRGDREGAEAPPEEAVALRGVVVATSPAARSYALALAGGELAAVHAAELPDPGAKLAVEAAALPNNTFAELGRERSGAARQAVLRGVVTHADAERAEPVYTVSGRGASVLVHAAPQGELPGRGAGVTVTVAIAEPPSEPSAQPPPAPDAEGEAGAACLPDPALPPPRPPRAVLRQRKLVSEPEPVTYLDLAGVVSAVCAPSGQLLLSADGARVGGADLALAVPAAFDLAALRPGAPVVATATLAPDGSLTLAGIAGDAGRKGAEAIATAQGDLARR